MGYEPATTNSSHTARCATAQLSVKRAETAWQKGDKEEAYRLIHNAFELFDAAFSRTTTNEEAS